MEKINKEYYEKLKTINYTKVETTLYNKLKDYGIWWIKNRVEDAENYSLYFDNKIEYFKKHIRKFLKKCIKEYDEKELNITYNENLKKYETAYRNENIPMLFINNEYDKELKRVEIIYRNETYSFDIPQSNEFSHYDEYLNPNEYLWTDIDSEAHTYEEDKKILESGTYCYENIEYLMIITAYILVTLQDSSWKKGFNLDSLELPKNIGEFYIKNSRFEFKNHILDLINKFEKDELLAFILFAFDLNYYLNKKSKKGRKLLTSPLADSLSKLSFKLLDIKNDDYVINLYSELGGFVMESFFNSLNIKIRGIEDFTIVRNIAILKASLISNNITFSDITPDYSDLFSDDIPEPDEEMLTPALEYVPKQKVDKIFSNLSLIPDYYNKKNLISSNFKYYNKGTKEEATKRYREYYMNNSKISKEIIEESSLEWLSYIKLIEEQLKDEGRAVSLVEKNILYNTENKNIRKYFIENGYIEAIILLPENIMLDVTSSLIFIIFSRENKEIKFIDASSFGKIKKFKRQQLNIITDSDIDKIINLLNTDANDEISLSKKIEDFSKNEYNLDVTQNIAPLKEAKNSVRLKNLVKNIMKGSQISADELNEIRINNKNEKTPYIYLSLADINDGLIEFENVKEYITKIPEKQEKFCIKNNFILLSKYGIPDYKFAIVQIPNNTEIEKILASGNFIIIEVDEKQLNPWYLGALLSSDKGIEILKIAYSGSKLLSLSIKKLEEVMIPLLTLEEQNKIAEEYKTVINEIKELKKKLNDKIQITKEIYIKYNEDFSKKE